MKTILFVYGTLKRGMKNYQLLAGQAFLNSTRTMPCYRLLDLGSYPGLILDGHTDWLSTANYGK